MKKLEEYVRSIPDFPEPGIIFQGRNYHPSGFRRSAPGSGQHPQYVKGCRL